MNEHKSFISQRWDSKWRAWMTHFGWVVADATWVCQSFLERKSHPDLKLLMQQLPWQQPLELRLQEILWGGDSYQIRGLLFCMLSLNYCTFTKSCLDCSVERRLQMERIFVLCVSWMETFPHLLCAHACRIYASKCTTLCSVLLS